MRFSGLLPGILAAPALLAAELQIEITLPEPQDSNYQRPYVAFWLEKPDRQPVASLDVWYRPEQAQWLTKLSQWWMRSGRHQRFPIDGISAATRPAGVHQLTFTDQQPPLAGLAPGNYVLLVEASRELGRKELLQFLFSWPPRQEEQRILPGQKEIGQVSLALRP